MRWDQLQRRHREGNYILFISFLVRVSAIFCSCVCVKRHVFAFRACATFFLTLVYPIFKSLAFSDNGSQSSHLIDLTYTNQLFSWEKTVLKKILLRWPLQIKSGITRHVIYARQQGRSLSLKKPESFDSPLGV